MYRNIKNIINIDKKKAVLYSNKQFRCLELTFAGSVKTISLLPNNYILKKSLNKIIILF